MRALSPGKGGKHAYMQRSRVENRGKVLSLRNTVARDLKPTFNSLREALSLPAPERGKPFVEYSHQEFSRFKVRVHPADAKGRVLRQWAIRAKFTVAGKEKEDRNTYGQLEALEKTDVVVEYRHALRQVLDRLEEIERLKASPELAKEAARQQQRLTVAGAWAGHASQTRLQRDATTEKEHGTYRRYLSHLADCYLDELPYAFWSKFAAGLSAGRLLNADGLTSQALSSARAEATVIGVMNLASKLYNIGHRLEGLPGKDKSWNPAREARKEDTGTPNVRRGHIPLSKIAAAWRAADVLCESWARDQLRLYILSGLRHSLLAELQYSEVDVRGRRLKLSPHKRGTKRRKKDLAANAPDILLPLSNSALQIIEARRQYAPDAEGPVWYAIKKPGGKAAKAGVPKIATHSDPRSNWAHISKEVLGGMSFLRHDLRRTFAQIALQSGADLVGTSLLMLHAPRTLAKLMDVPDITVAYMNTPLAQKRMRDAADAIERYVLGLLAGSIVPAEEDLELPPELAAAVGKEED